MRHQAAHRNTGIGIEEPNHRLKDCTSNIFKIYIHAIWADLGQFLDQVLAPMADTRVEPQRIHHVPTFLFGTGNADHLAANVESLLAPPLAPATMARLDALFGNIDSVSGN